MTNWLTTTAITITIPVPRWALITLGVIQIAAGLCFIALAIHIFLTLT